LFLFVLVSDSAALNELPVIALLSLYILQTASVRYIVKLLDYAARSGVSRSALFVKHRELFHYWLVLVLSSWQQRRFEKQLESIISLPVLRHD
jgi:hypothetical protein